MNGKLGRIVKKVGIAFLLTCLMAWVTSCVSKNIKANNDFYELKVKKAYEYENQYSSSYYIEHVSEIKLFRDGEFYYVQYGDQKKSILDEGEREIIDHFIQRYCGN